MILVTGATGLVGSYLLLDLAAKEQAIIALTRNIEHQQSTKDLFYQMKSSNFDRIVWVACDLLDITTLDEVFSQYAITKIYHAAAIISFDESKGNKLINNNFIGTKNLVDVALSYQVNQMVYFGSIATLNDKKQQQFFNELAEFNLQIPHSSYALSKHLAEMEVWRASQEGMRVLVLNIGVIIGSLDTNRASEALFAYSAKKYCFIPTGASAFVDVRDVVTIAQTPMDETIKNQRFVLVSENLSYQKIIRQLRKELGLNRGYAVSKKSLKVVRVLSVITAIFGFDFFSESSYLSLTQTSLFSNQKAKETFQIQFIPIKESLKYHQKQYLQCKNSNPT